MYAASWLTSLPPSMAPLQAVVQHSPPRSKVRMRNELCVAATRAATGKVLVAASTIIVVGQKACTDEKGQKARAAASSERVNAGLFK